MIADMNEDLTQNDNNNNNIRAYLVHNSSREADSQDGSF